jgi:hypothetical protein
LAESSSAAHSATASGETDAVESFTELHAEAERALEAAAGAGAEWLSTRELLAQAARESEQGNRQASLELARQALRQAHAALEQAERESAAWRNRVVR